ncbi:chromate transporter-domain-containing protein [Lasiosphaeria ovina]|uniref:Chromate transporter-domain-containing protein n=1 Tax=Lasiosphaeria ovina TaxID=92902 RepID=A0AAE0N105_9PEZI|nr:chromate transporter-domain-containing protein [Lasiosphaeria ovina]
MSMNLIALSSPTVITVEDFMLGDHLVNWRRGKKNADLTEPDPGKPVSDSPSPDDDLGLSDNSNVLKMSYLRLFWFFFYNFGLFAWGGPVAQIALIKDKLVLIGGIVAGVAFALPGFVLMLLASYLYSLAGFENKYFNASFSALQPIILRATHKIAEHSVKKHDTKNPFLVIAAIFTAINMALCINIFISLGLYGVIYTFVARRLWIPAAALFVLQYVGYALYVVFRGVPSPVALALGIAKTPSMINLFVLGLVAGTLSFGGAYTAIPFVQVEAVLLGTWLPQGAFIDGIAIGNILLAPLVIFATFVGFQGAYLDGSLGNAFSGAVVITLGMFFPCFLFTIAGHELLEKLFLASFFDGLCGSVIGVIAGSSDRVRDKPVGEAIAKAAQVGPAAVLYLLALVALYKFTNKYTALLLAIMGAVVGQFLFID